MTAGLKRSRTDTINELLEILEPYKDDNYKWNEHSLQGIKAEEMENAITKLTNQPVKTYGDKPSQDMRNVTQYNRRMMSYTGIKIKAYNNVHRSFFIAVGNYLESKNDE